MHRVGGVKMMTRQQQRNDASIPESARHHFASLATPATEHARQRLGAQFRKIHR